MRASILLAICCAAPACAASGASIEMRPQATVSGRTVLLGDVARLHSDDLSLMRTLANLPLGRAPQSGDLALLQRDALAQWVRRQHDFAAGQLAWTGASETKVLRRSPRVSGDDIADAASRSLSAALVAQGQDGTVEVRIPLRDVAVPAGPVRLEVRGLEQAGASSRAVLWVDVWAAERFVRTVPVSLDIAKGSVAPERSRATESERTARAAEIEPSVVARGDWATLRSTDGVITIESRVEVLQDGRPGQKIRVRAKGATAPGFARVLGRGQLELLP